MSAWDSVAKKVEEKDAANSVWIKLPKSGDRCVAVFRGEPFLRESCFDDKEKKPVPLAEARLRKLKIRTTVAFNVVLWPSKEVKVLEKGTGFFKDVAIIRNKYGLDKWAFEITRHGDGLKTEYKILPEVQLRPEDLEEINKLQLHDLPKLYAEEGSDWVKSEERDRRDSDTDFNYGANAPL